MPRGSPFSTQSRFNLLDFDTYIRHTINTQLPKIADLSSQTCTIIHFVGHPDPLLRLQILPLVALLFALFLIIGHVSRQSSWKSPQSELVQTSLLFWVALS